MVFHEAGKKTEKAGMPQIRFAGFDDEWERHTFGKLSEKTFGGGTPNTANKEYWNGDIPWIQSSDILDGKLFGVVPKKFISKKGLSSSAAQFIPENSIAIIIRVGVGKLTFMPFSYTTSQDFMSLSKLKTEPFFTVYACYKKLQSELNAVQGTSIKGITKDELLMKQITIPNYTEQQKIGVFFKNCDHLITLHQSKYDKLIDMKKAMLEKMFPKDGEAVPEIRFKGFSDAWEQRKAKELCSISTGKSNTQDRIEDGKYPFYVRSPIVERSNRYLFDEEAVLTVGDGVGTGKVFHYVNGKYDLHQRVYRMFGFSEEISAKYFYYYFSNHFYDRVMAMTAKTSVDSVRYEMIADMEISLPNKQEQICISMLFEQLDNLITLHQCKLEKLKNLKKAFLEKMFI